MTDFASIREICGKKKKKQANTEAYSGKGILFVN